MIVNQTYAFLLPQIEGLAVASLPSFSPKPPLLYSIRHETHYRYAHPVSRSKHLFRLQPVQDLSQTVLQYRVDASVQGAELCNFTGAFGNHASFLEIQEPYSELVIVSKSIVALSGLPQQMDLVHQPRTLPLIWMPWDRIMMQAYLQPPELEESELFVLADYAMSFVDKNQSDVFEVLQDMNRTIQRDFTYAAGCTNLYTTAYEVFTHRKGVCQDFSNLLICLARLLNIPARYRVGYLYTGGHYENRAQADASHAWVEVFLPYIGWVGFDPTNGCLAQESHIRIACGRYYKDATPTSGALFETEGGVKETLTTSVEVIQLGA